MLSRVHLAFHARIQDFSSGVVRVNLTKKALTTFFLVLSLFYWSQMVNFEENYNFSRFQRGSNIDLWFSRGGGGGGGADPLTPLWIRTCYLDQQEIAFSVKSSLGGIFQFHLNFDRPWFCKQIVASGDPTYGSRGGLGDPDPPGTGKSQVLWVSLDTPTPWKKLDPLLPSVIKPLDPLCKL